MRTVAIVGVGLIGGSFGLALRKAGFTGSLLGVSSPPAIAAGLAAGAISAAATLEEAAEQADLIYLAQPVDRIIETIRLLGPLVRKDTFITDAGSTKSVIVQTALEHLPHGWFAGGHPMAGKETRGAQSADADLFRNRPYVLTPAGRSAPEEFLQLLNAIGAIVLEMAPGQHDSTVALTSHLPQLISTALSAFLASQNRPEIQQVFGSGLMDMTRLALSPAELWTSILSTNQEYVRFVLQSYAESLLVLCDSLKSPSLQSTFGSANQFAADLRKISY